MSSVLVCKDVFPDYNWSHPSSSTEPGTLKGFVIEYGWTFTISVTSEGDWYTCRLQGHTDDRVVPLMAVSGSFHVLRAALEDLRVNIATNREAWEALYP